MSLSTITPLVQIFFSVLGFAYLATSNKATQLQPSYTPTASPDKSLYVPPNSISFSPSSKYTSTYL